MHLRHLQKYGDFPNSLAYPLMAVVNIHLCYSLVLNIHQMCEGLSTSPPLSNNCHSLAIGQCSSVHSKPSEINVVKGHIHHALDCGHLL